MWDYFAIESEIEKDLLAATFAMNALADSGSILHDRTYTVRTSSVHTVTQSTGFNLSVPSEGHSYSFKKGATSSEVSTIFKNVSKAISLDNKLKISLRRFNASLNKKIPDEKVIDLAICLESMFGSMNEISFQFSLYNAIITDSDANRRYENYKKLKDLYKWRSKIVHGSHELDQHWFDENWQSLRKLATIAILAKTEFINGHGGGGDWTPHLERLALGGSE